MEKSILDKTITMCERVGMPWRVAVVNLLSVLKTDKYKALADTCRGLKTKDERKIFKLKNVPVITVGGLFNKYKREINLLQHSGLICLDMDGVEDISALKEKVIKLPFIAYCGLSVSGTGLFAIIHIPISTPKEHFNRYAILEGYFIKDFGIDGTVDPAPKNVAAARYVSYDPDAYFNHDATVYDKLPQPVINKIPKPVIRKYKANSDDEKVWAMVELIQQRRLDFAPDYGDYLRIAFALANGLGEQGRQVFHAVCQYSPLYRYDEAERKFNEALKSKNGKVTLATFFGYCKDFGLMPEKQLSSFPVYVPKPIKADFKIKTFIPEPVIWEPLSTQAPAMQIKKPETKVTTTWSREVNELEKYFAGITLPARPVKLNQCSTIFNIPLFLETHFETLKANDGKKTFLPYLSRLRELQRIFKL